jgi:hypothetical protein
METDKHCGSCKKIKPLSEFHKALNKKAGYTSYCKDCSSKYSSAKYKTDVVFRKRRKDNNKKVIEDNRQWLIDYLKEHPCAVCGEADIVVLEFDHIDRSTKEYTIAKMLSYSINTIKKELEKCQVLCVNCHKRKTAKEINSLKFNYNNSPL